jgi:hypothetical protein
MRSNLEVQALARCRYQDPHSTQTLAEGLAEYRARNPDLFDPDALSRDERLGGLGRFFAAHDACHVLFGLDTSLPDESLADTWTLCGTDVRWAELRGYFKSEAQRALFKDLLRQVWWWRAIWEGLCTLPRMVRAMLRARRMSRKWPLHEWPRYLDVPLRDIRRAFRIELV